MVAGSTRRSSPRIRLWQTGNRCAGPVHPIPRPHGRNGPRPIRTRGGPPRRSRCLSGTLSGPATNTALDHPRSRRTEEPRRLLGGQRDRVADAIPPDNEQPIAPGRASIWTVPMRRCVGRLTTESPPPGQGGCLRPAFAGHPPLWPGQPLPSGVARPPAKAAQTVHHTSRTRRNRQRNGGPLRPARLFSRRSRREIRRASPWHTTSSRAGPCTAYFPLGSFTTRRPRGRGILTHR